MKIILAPDSFKESLTAPQVAEAMACGIGRYRQDIQLVHCPIADGGEGTVQAMATAVDVTCRTTTVIGPLGEPVDAQWAMLDDRTAVIEMAQAAGLQLVPENRRDPTVTTTYGLGQLILAAADAGATRLIIGIGGSATCDGGIGMAAALGYRLVGVDNQYPAGGDLMKITGIDTTHVHPALTTVQCQVACDVTNPLTGPQGAAQTYGPQKGATAQQVQQLDQGLAHWRKIARQANLPIIEQGAGAAGGLGFALAACCRAEIHSGIELILDAVGFEQLVHDADLVITGEGRLDGQSLQGKACLGVARAAAKHHVPTVALAGALTEDANRCMDHGLTACYSICNAPMSLAQAMTRTPELLADAAEQIVRLFDRT